MSEGIASTYSCANCCQNSVVDGTVVPGSAGTVIGDTTAFIATQTEINCYSQQFTDIPVQSAYWDSSDANVATVDGFGSADSVGVGQSDIQAEWEGVIWYNFGGGHCEAFPIPIIRNSPVEVFCAYPTNFRQVGNGEDKGNGVLQFNYAWNSSTGNMGHLSQCLIGEIVTYQGTNPFSPPSPPFKNISVSNPTIQNFSAETGSAQDNHSPPGGSFVTPYISTSFTATQYYRYSCPCVNDGQWTNVAGPLEIVRTVDAAGESQWKYTITKSGASATINPLP